MQRQANRSLDKEDTTLQVGRSTIMEKRNNGGVLSVKGLFLETR